jgi:hypothetical protein
MQYELSRDEFSPYRRRPGTSGWECTSRFSTINVKNSRVNFVLGQDWLEYASYSGGIVGGSDLKPSDLKCELPTSFRMRRRSVIMIMKKLK